MTSPQLVLLEQLIADPAVHGRARVHQGVVRRYARVSGDAERGNASTPVEVFRDSENRLWLADGFLRCYGSRAAGHRSIQAFLRDGDRRDAIRFACGANANHGLPLRQLDKREAAANLLITPEFREESDASMARRAGVSRALVAELRPHCGSAEEYEAHKTTVARHKWLHTKAYQEAQGKGHSADAARWHLRANGLPEPPQRPKESERSKPPSDPAPTSDPPAGKPPTGEPADDRPIPDPSLSPREQAMQLLARASASAAQAKRAMAEAQREYPEAFHFPALAAVVESQGELEDMLPDDSKTDPVGGVDPREVLSTMGELCGVKPDLRDVAIVPFSVLPDPNPPPKTIFDSKPASQKGRQPETLHPPGRGKSISDWIANRAQQRGSPPFD